MDQDQLQDKLKQIDIILNELKSELQSDSPQSPREPMTNPQSESKKPKQDAELESVGSRDDESDKGPPLGQVGIFDGEFVIMPNEKRYQVPPNYASKTMLVVGDALELVAHGDQNEFKIAKQIERVEFTGILTKKNYQWTVVKDEYEFKVIPAAIRYHGGDIGDNVTVFLPVGYEESKPVWGAVKSVEKANVGSGGFAGSSSAEDIATKKRMKYVPEKDIKENGSKTTPNNIEASGGVAPVEKVVSPPPSSNTKSTQEPPQSVPSTKIPTVDGGEIVIDTSSKGEVPLVIETEKASQLATISVVDDVPPLR